MSQMHKFRSSMSDVHFLVECSAEPHLAQLCRTMTKMLMGEHPYLDIRSFGQEVKSVLYRKYEQLRKEKGLCVPEPHQLRHGGRVFAVGWDRRLEIVVE